MYRACWVGWDEFYHHFSIVFFGTAKRLFLFNQLCKTLRPKTIGNFDIDKPRTRHIYRFYIWVFGQGIGDFYRQITWFHTQRLAQYHGRIGGNVTMAFVARWLGIDAWAV